MNEINPSSISKIDIAKIYKQQQESIIKGNKTGESSDFKGVLKGFMNEVSDLQHQANDKLEKLATGEIKDIHEVMIAATEADTSFKIMMEIRNKLMAAYKEIAKM